MSGNQDFVKIIESEETFRDLFDYANDLIHFASPEGNLLYVNAAWMKTLGYQKEELQNQNLYFLVHEEDLQAFKTYREGIIYDRNETSLISFRLRGVNGQYSTVEGFITPKYRNGKILYTRAILRDISQRVENERKLQFFTNQLLEREENFRQLIHHAPDAIIVINEQSLIQLWNPMAEQIFGWKMEDVIGNKLVDTIIPPEYHHAHLVGMERFLTTGESHIFNKTVEVMARNIHGNQFYISLTISAYQISSRKMFIAFLRDISLQKQNEFELDERRKQLERSNEELEKFAWLTSHDLKEPLRKIMTFSDLLMSKHHPTLNDEASRYLDKIHSAANRMSKLIEAILVYSNISHEQQLYQVVDLNGTVREVLSDLEVSLSEKDAKVQVDLLPSVEAIPHQMRQLFQNLISNALKYMRPGVTPEITISHKSDNGMVTIWVRDNGIGFEELYAEKIFQVFQRLESADKYEGTGIGLAVCKKIVENHGGRIGATGEPGKGSEFEFTLPIKQQFAKTKAPHSEM